MSNILVRAKVLEIARQLEAINSVDAKADHIISSLLPPQEPQTRVERLKAEYEELASKHQALTLYMRTNNYHQLERDEKFFMDQQSRAMNAYLSALRMRLDLYGVYV